MKRLAILILFLGLGTWAFGQNSNADQKLLDNAGQVLQTMANSNIPSSVLSQAQCVAVIPSMTKAGFIVGGEHGNGVVSCRTSNGWSAPAFFSISGGSVGLQAGAVQNDIVLLMNQQGKQEFTNDNFNLGANLVAQGPTGANASAGVSTWTAPILSYTRSKNGAFAGANIQGTKVSMSQNDMNKVYGNNASVQNVLNGSVQPPSQAQTFLNDLQQLGGR